MSTVTKDSQRLALDNRLGRQGMAAEEVLRALRGVVPNPAFLHEPEFAGRERAYILDCIDTGWVSSVGAYVDRFERDLAAFTGSPFAVATTNGTAALHLCLHLLGVRAGDEVIIPALTFVATANAVAYTGATCHFADIDATTLGIDAGQLEHALREVARVERGVCFNRQTGRPIRALVCVHTFGHPADLDALKAVCAPWGIALVEDAAESLGSYYKGKHTGTLAPLAALSFNGNKIITTGGGGAILTQDAELARRAKHLSTTAKVPHRWEYVHDEIGFNYRLPNINAALGCAQLEQIERFLADKRNLATRYASAFAHVHGVRLFTEANFARSNYWLNALLLEDAADLPPLLEACAAAGYGARPAWRLLHRLAMYKECPRMDLRTAEDVAARLINLPSSAVLGRK